MQFDTKNGNEFSLQSVFPATNLGKIVHVLSIAEQIEVEADDRRHRDFALQAGQDGGDPLCSYASGVASRLLTFAHTQQSKKAMIKALSERFNKLP